MSTNQLSLAASAVKNQGLSQQRASILYNVPQSSLSNYIARRTNKNAADLKKQKLLVTEEADLVRWILSMDNRGLPPRPSTVRSMADFLLEKRGDGIPETVGKNWTSSFVNRHPELKSKFVRKFSYKRSRCEDPKIIQNWFQLVQNITSEYRILPDDTYNMDEVGFSMGMISTCMVVTNSERKERPKLLQPDNREWTTVIAGINALGWALAPMIIFKGKNPPVYEDEIELPPNLIVKSSPNGWTTDELSLFWLKEVFDKQTRDRTKGRYRLLIMDSHGRHVTPEFDSFCMENQIVLLYMPPHSSHILQPLDVSCFAALKKSYGRLVENQIRCGINHVDKVDFLSLYPEVHTSTFSEKNIQSGFSATGLIPYAPYEVLSKLPPSTPSHNSLSSWTPKTPKNTDEIRRQLARLRNRNRTTSLSDPTDQFMDTMLYHYERLITDNILLTQENMELRTALERKKRKSTYVPHGGAARRVQAGDGDPTQDDSNGLAQRADEDFVRRSDNDPVQLADGESSQEVNNEPVRKKRAPSRCSVCRALEHTARNCPRLG